MQTRADVQDNESMSTGKSLGVLAERVARRCMRFENRGCGQRPPPAFFVLFGKSRKAISGANFTASYSLSRLSSPTCTLSSWPSHRSDHVTLPYGKSRLRLNGSTTASSVAAQGCRRSRSASSRCQWQRAEARFGIPCSQISWNLSHSFTSPLQSLRRASTQPLLFLSRHYIVASFDPHEVGHMASGQV